ncbi:MAG: quinolinate synthase NadA [Rectinemataceae bacterium]
MSETSDAARLADETRMLREELGPSVVIAAHHYQRPEITALADFVGDSFMLAREAGRTQAEFIVLSGVRFMAESAAILSREGQKVLIPDAAAACPMADMIDAREAEAALGRVAAACRLSVLPVSYMNSYADVKSFTGACGGSVCTSSNAGKIVAHYLSRGNAVFFLPDYNLGRNTAAAMGIPDDQVFTVRKGGRPEGDGDPALGRLFLWDGWCHVHKSFTPGDVLAARSRHPGVRVIVHPECDRAVVAAADASGSTEAIYKAIKESPEGMRWAVGTEASFVSRMAAEFPDREVMHLRVSTCFNMSRIRLENLHSSLASIKAFRERGSPLLFRVEVAERHRSRASAALRAMLDIVEAGT